MGGGVRRRGQVWILDIRAMNKKTTRFDGTTITNTYDQAGRLSQMHYVGQGRLSCLPKPSATPTIPTASSKPSPMPPAPTPTPTTPSTVSPPPPVPCLQCIPWSTISTIQSAIPPTPSSPLEGRRPPRLRMNTMRRNGSRKSRAVAQRRKASSIPIRPKTERSLRCRIRFPASPVPANTI